MEPSIRSSRPAEVASFHAVGLQATGDLTSGTKYGVAVPNTDQAFVDEVYKKVKTAAISFEQPTNSGSSTRSLPCCRWQSWSDCSCSSCATRRPEGAKRCRSAARARRCSTKTARRLPSPTSRVSTRPRKSWLKSSTSSRIRRNTNRLERAFPRACCCSGRRAPANAAGSRDRGRSRRAVLLDIGFGLRRDVRRRRRVARSRFVRSGEEVRAVYRVHRRNRRRRPSARRRPRRRSRRARTNAQPVARRDGRLRSKHRRHSDRGNEPCRRARSRR